MKYRFSQSSVEQLKKDIGKKVLQSDCQLSGSVKGEKVELYTVDHYGKHSNFLNEHFYGRFSEGCLVGSFRISNYALVCMAILLAVAIETVVTALLFQKPEGVITPVVIIAAIIGYYFYLKKSTKAGNSLIEAYLKELSEVPDNDNSASE